MAEWKRPLRYLIVLLMVALAISQAVGAIQSWRQYRELREPDPSAADAYLTFAQVDAVLAGLSLAFAGLVWWLFRPRKGKPG
jgi:hypothetical protein